jgi:outer membrane receptor protein involved in Fe transport
LRAILALLLLLSVAGQAAEGDLVQYAGRSVADVIDEFRDAGYPFAYSSSLVGADLMVESEPDSVEPVNIVREILKPHRLTIKEQAGILLVVRFDAVDGVTGKIRLVITNRGSDRPVDKPEVTVDPGLKSGHQLTPGVYEYSNVAPGSYEFAIQALGFDPVRRIVDVWPGETTVVSVGLAIAHAEIETIAVSASRYEILRELATSRFVLDQRTIQNMPDVGEDPIRVTQRLPGAAASGASAKTHFRGGEESEIGIMLNGHPLFDPFHVRDYQSIFSAIDARAIEGVEVYTGGFPVRFGNRMSGLVLMESMDALQPRHTEIGVSVFNTSVLTAGNSADRRWVFSARRGNLDLVIDKKFGQPKYYDVFGELEFDFSADSSLSINALYADDQVQVVIETDPDEIEQVTSRTKNAQLWLQLENRWSSELKSKTVLSAVSFENLRDGSLNDFDKIVGSVYDDRAVSQFGFRQDFSWTRSNAHLLQWGLQASYSDATYEYRNQAEYYSLQALWPGRDEPSSLDLKAEPNGANFSLYVSDRWKATPRTVLELGLRWDDQTYTDLPSDAQLSPRVSLMHGITPKTEFRLSWGRYYQAQGVNDLQIEDGVTNFWPAQQADHLIAGVQTLINDNYSLRFEAFYKDMSHIRPRFENLFNPLGVIPELQPDRIRLDPSSAQSSGVEISVDRTAGPRTWWASYTLSRASDRIHGEDQLRSWDQRHSGQAGVSWSSDKWDVAFAAGIHTGWPSTLLTLVEDGVDDDGEPVFVVVPGPRNDVRLHTFASIDFRASRKWQLRRSTLIAFLEVTNLANRKNECCYDYDFEEDEDTGEEYFGRSLDYWLPLMPAVGILWEF